MILLLFIFATTIIAKDDCSYDDKRGTKCTIKIKDLYPTQFSIGNQEVLCKANFLDHLSRAELEDYLNKGKHTIPVIISQNRYYVIDGHHLTRALLITVGDDIKVNAEVIENWNKYTFEEFELAMIEKNLFYLYDSGQGPISPTLLPTFYNLDDDLFRTLSWLVRRAGGFDKGNIMYVEFIWADWLRTQIQLPAPDAPTKYCNIVPYSSLCIPNQKLLLESLIIPGLELALSPAAKDLPGWHQGFINAPDCGKGFSWHYSPWGNESYTFLEKK